MQKCGIVIWQEETHDTYGWSCTDRLNGVHRGPVVMAAAARDLRILSFRWFSGEGMSWRVDCRAEAGATKISLRETEVWPFSWYITFWSRPLGDISQFLIESMDNRNPTNLTWQSQHVCVFVEAVVFQGVFICLSRDRDLTLGLFFFCLSLRWLVSLSLKSNDLFKNSYFKLTPTLLGGPSPFLTFALALVLLHLRYWLLSVLDMSFPRARATPHSSLRPSA